MSANGTLLVITDLTLVNELLVEMGQIPTEYYNSYEIIKHSHERLLEETETNTLKLFEDINNYLITVLFCWSLLAVLLIFLYDCFIQMMIIK